MAKINQSQEEEIDLGSLFKIIGKGFLNLFNFIASIFIGLYKVFILLLIHFYKRTKWYLLALIVGLVTGYIIDKKSDDLYSANLFIETNFGSTRQVYENIKNLNQLAKIDRDTAQLALVLNLTKDEAATLKGFFINPDIDQNILAQQFSTYKKQLDSLALSEVNFDKYVDELKFYSYKTHQIQVSSTDKFIYKKLQNNLVNAIIANPYLSNLRDVTVENLQKEIISIERQALEIDTLAKTYLSIKIRESEKQPIPGVGTNVYLGDNNDEGSLMDESKLIKSKYELEIRKREASLELIENRNIVNIIADFPISGYDISRWYQKFKYLLPLLLFSLTFIMFMLIDLGKYLEKQDKILHKS